MNRNFLMRRAVPLAVALALMTQVQPASAQAASPPAHAAAAPSDWRPVIAGLGAIAGVVVFNVATLGVAALPGGLGYAAGATVPAEMSVAMSRVYATTSAVIGAWIGYYGYGR